MVRMALERVFSESACACTDFAFPSLGLSMKGVYKGGYLVMGLTALSTIGLCML